MKSLAYALDLDPSPTRTGSATGFGELNYPIFIHEKIIDDIARAPLLRRKLSLTLQRLASTGQTSVVKGCAPPNRGWRRSPMGGSGGNNFYLWWTVGGGRIVPSEVNARLGLKKSVWVRSLRNHGDMRPLSAGDTEAEYMPLRQAEITGEDDALVESPWTEQQTRFIESHAAVRTVYGHPGSGKTTALWRAVSARSGESTLYTSWSPDLLAVSMSYFHSFAPSSARIIGYDFRALLGLLCGRDVPRIDPARRTRLLKSALSAARISARDLGPWAGRSAELASEIRAVILGDALEDAPTMNIPGGGLRLSRDGYHKSRSAVLDKRAIDSTIRTVALLERTGHLQRIYPELTYTIHQARARLRAGRVPDGLETIDRFVIDEAQDLTLAEIDLLLQMCLTIGGRSGRTPWILISADEGQTVSPSGFDWGPLNRLLSQRLRPPEEFGMERKLRTPARISEVIDRASELYRTLGREIRPANQSQGDAPDEVQAEIYHAVVPERQTAARLVDELSDEGETVVITLTENPPEWLTPRSAKLALTPTDVKGLEFRAACIIDPGAEIARIGESIPERAHSPSLDYHAKRTKIDRLRVAISRVVETLIFLDVAADQDTLRLSRDMLGEHISCGAGDLMEHMRAHDSGPEDLALSRVRESERLIDSSPIAAWNRALQAARIIGEPGLPGGVKDASIRGAAQTNLLRVGARLISDGADPDGSIISECRKTAARAQGAERSAAALNILQAWIRNTTDCPIPLLRAALDLDEPPGWLGPSLIPHYQALQSGLDAAAASPETASLFTEDVQRWLSLSGYSGDTAQKTLSARITALGALTKAGQWTDATMLASKIPTENLRQEAAERVKQNRHLEAVHILRHIGEKREAKKNLSTYRDIQVDRAWRLIKENKYKEAIEICDEGERLMTRVAGPPLHPIVGISLVRAHANSNLRKYGEAISGYDNVIRFGKSELVVAAGHLGQAYIHYKSDDFIRARRKAVASMNLDIDGIIPFAMNAFEIAMFSSLRLNQYQSAAAYGFVSHRRNPNHMNVIKGLVSSLHKLRQHSLALRYCENGLNQDTDDNALWYLYSLTHAAQNNYREAAQSIEMLSENSSIVDDNLKNLYHAYFLGLSGQYIESMKKFEVCMKEMGGMFTVPLLCRAEVQSARGYRRLALNDTMDATAQMADDLETHMILLETYYENSETSLVINQCERIIDNFSPSDEVYLALGNALSARGQEQDAWEQGFTKMNPERWFPKTDNTDMKPGKLKPIPPGLRVRRETINILLGIESRTGVNRNLGILLSHESEFNKSLIADKRDAVR